MNNFAYPLALLGDIDAVVWVKQWLARSQALPLQLHLYFRVEDGDEALTNKAIQFMGYIFKEFHHRIRVLDLTVSVTPEIFFQLPHSSLRLLEKAPIGMGWDKSPPWIPCGILSGLLDRFPRGIEVLVGAPRLQCLHISDPNMVTMLDTLLLPAEQLTSLPLDVYVDILRHCKNLSSIGFHLEGRGPRSRSPQLLKLEELTALNIYCANVDRGATSLPFLTAPLLEDMVLRWRGQDIIDLRADMVGFQNRSQTDLSSLTLILDCKFHEDDLVINEVFATILAAFPSVTSSRIRDRSEESADEGAPYDVNSLVQAMITTKVHGSILLPKLTYPSSLTSMILSRWWPVESESLDIIGEGEQAAGKNNVVQRLKKVGVYGPLFRGRGH
ncbi:hypothetical protein BT96DRAFT_989713 [Gymnopus androsaceus JB14]|uniref:F-box domain-containing protein n=1 Tax=Gymnopus androsaceus JB14 TaxID=1447944 RepID=A0A6A4I5A0_9AGAR|nr:hypothetical protein BT96DRAFT_989713 [Gymnopus androsaceus JB14]